MDRAKRFYESFFQIQLERLDSPADMPVELWSFPMHKNQMGASGTLVKMKDGPSGGNCVLVYFSCTDCAAETARVPASGGQIVRENVYRPIRLHRFDSRHGRQHDRSAFNAITFSSF